jgi:hypothetical protein
MYATVVEGTVNLNPPHVTLATWPLAWLELPRAMVAWWLVSAVCAWWCVRRWREALPAPWHLVTFGAVLATMAGYSSSRFGSWTWLLTALSASAWVAYRRDDQIRTGALLAVIASWRVVELLFVPYLLWRRQWRALLAMGTTGLVIWVAGLIVAGPDAYVAWIDALGTVVWQGDPYNMSLLGMSQRVFGFSPFPPLMPRPSWVFPAWWLSCGVVVAVTVSHLRKSTDRDADWVAVVFTALLLSPLGWSGYWPLAAGPLLVSLRRHWGKLVEVAGAVVIIAWALPTREIAQGLPASPLLGLTLGSLHAWAGLLVWMYALAAARRSSPCSFTRAADHWAGRFSAITSRLYPKADQRMAGGPG